MTEDLQNWWQSDTYKQFAKAHQEDLERAVGKYHMLSENEKIDIVQAVCYIICKAEQEGTSHRGLQYALGIYPGGFWIDNLMDVHNALWTYYQDKNKEQEKDLETLQNFTETQRDP
jgi:hypothetical protein